MTDFDPAFSLTAVLQEILRRAGLTIDAVDLHGALGLPLLLAAAADQPPSAWPLLARDGFLIPAARLFGLEIRDLHPPEAARGLDRAAEFRQHFDASYRPLIARAMEHGQPVIARQGWETEASSCWGIIESASDRGVGFAGLPFSPYAISAQNVALSGPPVQVYVVESLLPRRPDGRALLGAALCHARAALDPAWGERFGLFTGPAALDHWKTLSDEPSRYVPSRSWSHGAQSMARFLARHASVTQRPAASGLLIGVGGLCNRLVEDFRREESAGPRSVDWARTCSELSDRLGAALQEEDPIGETTS